MQELMSGNAAIARGALEAGVHYATGYPGTPSTEILENIATYPEIESEWSTNEKVAFEVAMGAAYGATVHVLAGRGNNGGDGYVAARYLSRRGVAVTVHHNGVPAPDTVAWRAMRAADRSGVRIQPLGDVIDGSIIVDALYGTGFRGDLPAVAAPWATTDIPVLSVDIPSGVSGDTGIAEGQAFRAQRTATFHMLKTGHLLGDGPDRCGVIDLYDIGLRGGEPSVWRFTDADVARCTRLRTDHKWSVGAVATLGGTPGLTGAALLAARSAIVSRTGM